MENREYLVRFDRSMIEHAVRTFILRRTLRRPIVWLGELLAIAALAVDLWSGDRTWVAGLYASVVLLLPALILIAWHAQRRNSLDRLRRLGEPVAHVAFSDEGLSIRTSLGSGALHWSTLTEIWETERYWLVFVAPSQFNILPIRDLPEEALARLAALTAEVPRPLAAPRQ